SSRSRSAASPAASSRRSAPAAPPRPHRAPPPRERARRCRDPSRRRRDLSHPARPGPPPVGPGGLSWSGPSPHRGARALRAPPGARPRAPERRAVIEILEASPLLTLFLVVATGAVLGAIPFGRVRFGAAGALFTGLALSAAAPHLGAGMDIVQTLGLALFVYTVGISAGAAFFANLNKQLPLLGVAALSSVLGAIITVVLGGLLGLAQDLSLGLFTGALTAAPALDAAQRITGTTGPSVGYAFGYPFGVIVGIVLVSLIVNRSWPGRKDTPALAGTSLHSTTVHVLRPRNLRDVPQWHEQRVRFSYLRRDGRIRVIVPGEDLLTGDEVVAVGMREAVDEVVAELGERSTRHLAHDRSLVEFTRL